MTLSDSRLQNCLELLDEEMPLVSVLATIPPEDTESAALLRLAHHLKTLPLPAARVVKVRRAPRPLFAGVPSAAAAILIVALIASLFGFITAKPSRSRQLPPPALQAPPAAPLMSLADVYGNGVVYELHWLSDGDRLLLEGAHGLYLADLTLYDPLDPFAFAPALLEGYFRPARVNPVKPQIVSADAGGKSVLWDADTGAPLMTVHPDVNAVLDLTSAPADQADPFAFSPDGSQLAAYLGDGRFQVWDTGTLESLHTVEIPMTRLLALAYHQEAQTWLALGLNQVGGLLMWDVLKEAVLYGDPQPPHAPFFIPTRARFSPDGRIIASGTLNQIPDIAAQARLSFALQDSLTGTYFEPFPNGNDIVFTPDSQLFSSFSFETGFRMQNMDGRTVNLGDHLFGVIATGFYTPDVETIAFSPDNRRVAMVIDTGWVRAFSYEENPLTAEILFFQSPIHTLALAPDGKTVAAAYNDHVRLWDAAGGGQVGILPDGRAGGPDWPIFQRSNFFPISSLAFSPDGRRLFFAAFTPLEWEVETHHYVNAYRGFDKTYALDVSPDGNLLAFSAGYYEGNSAFFVGAPNAFAVRLWDLATNTLAATDIERTTPITHLFFDAGGESLFAADGDGKVMRIPNGVQSLGGGGNWEVQAHASPVAGMALTPDNQTLITVDAGGFVRFTDVRDGHQIRTLNAPSATIGAFALSPDGDLMAFASAARRSTLWLVETTGGEIVAEVVSGHVDLTTSLLFQASEDGLRLFSGSLDGTLRVWAVSAE